MVTPRRRSSISEFLDPELEAGRVLSGDSDLLKLKSYMGIPILTTRELLEEFGEAPEE